jgi:hypothetical protein
MTVGVTNPEFYVTVGVTLPAYAGGGRRGTVGPRAGALVAGVAALVALALSACGGLTPGPGAAPTSTSTSTQAPAPTPTVAALPNPTAAPQSPSQPQPPTQPQPQTHAQPQPTFDPTAASPADVENAFLSNVDDLIAEVTDLAVTPCPDMIVVTRQNPNLVPSIRGFAAAVKRISATQAVLNTDAVKTEVSDLDQSMTELEGALSLCGIK